jgi:hypothetical protein
MCKAALSAIRDYLPSFNSVSYLYHPALTPLDDREE